MGRRAKNKQGDPESLRKPNEHASSNQLGKRKANPGFHQKRPAKKVKDLGRFVTKSDPRHTEKEEWSSDSEES